MTPPVSMIERANGCIYVYGFTALQPGATVEYMGQRYEVLRAVPIPRGMFYTQRYEVRVQER